MPRKILKIGDIPKAERNTENERDQLIKELYKPTRINFPRRRVEIRGKDDVLEIDLAELTRLKKDAKGFTRILVATNPFTKMCYARPLKTKTGIEVAKALKEILEETKLKFKHVWSDKGSEFYNLNVKELFKKNGIHHYSTFSRIKTCHCERMIRTLKVALYRAMEFEGNYNWVPLLPIVVKTINSSVHSRLKIIPNKLTKNDEKRLEKIYSIPREINKNTRFKINDSVRISNPPTLFRRAFYPYWSPHIYKVVGINIKTPHTYQLEDYKGKKLNRTFYQEELQKTRYPDVWLIERVVKKSGKKCLVRWLGFGKEDDMWVNCNEIGKGRSNKKK